MNDKARAAIYVSNADSGEITVFDLDRGTGRVHLSQRVAVNGTVMPLALSPDRRFLYAAIRSEPFKLLSFERDPRTGHLISIGDAPLPDSMAYIAVDRTGRWLLAASYPGHKASVSPVDANGVAGAAATVMPTGLNAHAIVVDPSNRHVFVTNLGSDQVLQFRFDAATGELMPGDPPQLETRKGAGPRHLVIHPDGEHAYLLHELDATVDLLSLDSRLGTLSPLKTWPTLPAGSNVKPWAADLHLTPDGKWLYTSERNTSTIAIWKVDAASGELTLAGHQPTETHPRGFNVDSTGRWLVAAGQASNRLTVYAIDAATGMLDAKASVATGKNPNWVEIADLA